MPEYMGTPFCQNGTLSCAFYLLSNATVFEPTGLIYCSFNFTWSIMMVF